MCANDGIETMDFGVFVSGHMTCLHLSPGDLERSFFWGSAITRRSSLSFSIVLVEGEFSQRTENRRLDGAPARRDGLEYKSRFVIAAPEEPRTL
jgi:hypothetical protein